MKTTQEIKTNINRMEDEDNRLSSDINTTVDNSVDSDNNNKPMNNFESYGFTADFEGEIFYINKKYGTIHGIVLEEGSSYSIEWNHAGQVLNITLSRGVKSYVLTPIKKHWYDNPANFPALLVWDSGIDTPSYRSTISKDSFIKLHRQGWKLATKEEANSLYCEG